MPEMLRTANLTTKNLRSAVEFYKKYNLDLNPRPRLPVQYASPGMRIDFSQETVKHFIETLVKAIYDQGYQAILLAALPDVSVYASRKAFELGMEVYTPLIAKSRELIGVVRILR